MRVLAAIIAALWLLNSTNQLGVNADEKAVRRAFSIWLSRLEMVSCVCKQTIDTHAEEQSVVPMQHNPPCERLQSSSKPTPI